MTKIRTRLFIFTAIIIVFVAWLLSFYHIGKGKEVILEKHIEMITHIGDILLDDISNAMYTDNIGIIRDRLHALRIADGVTKSYVLDSNFLVVTDGTRDNVLRGTEVTDEFLDTVIESVGWSTYVDDKTFKVGRYLLLGGKVVGLLIIVSSLNEIIILQDMLLTESAIISLLCLFVGLSLAWWVASSVSTPIVKITNVANRICEGEIILIPITGRGEIRDLSISLRKMLDLIMKSEQDLKELNQSLDTTVKLRTEQLEKSLTFVNSSISCASNIQKNSLPNEELFSWLLPSSFVVWEPRDTVSGDIYWCRLWGLGTLLMVGDCTGHGVPGAFMTLVANGSLVHSLHTTQEGELGLLVTNMNDMMQDLLGRNRSSLDDGVELGAIYLPPEKEHILFVGARFSLYYHDKDGEVVEVKSDRTGIGFKDVPYNVVFQARKIDIVPGRRFYLATDGVTDQIGEGGRGFGKPRFKKLLQELGSVEMCEVGNAIYNRVLAFQGSETRRDDITIVGVEL